VLVEVDVVGPVEGPKVGPMDGPKDGVLVEELVLVVLDLDTVLKVDAALSVDMMKVALVLVLRVVLGVDLE